MAILYEEKAPFKGNGAIALVLALLLVTVLGAWAILIQVKTFMLLYISVLLAFILLAMWAWYRMKFRVTTEGVEAAFALWTYHVPFSHMKKAEALLGVPWWWGWGVRMWGRRIAFLSHHNACVKLEKNTGFFHTVVLSVSDPQVFLREIEQAKARAKR